MKNIIAKLLKNIKGKLLSNNSLMAEIELFSINQAKSLIQQSDYTKRDCLTNYEFKVFSQWGDDGIIQYLINTVDVKNRKFIEFGVEDYSESNTRFLLFNNNWSGLIMDGSFDNMKTVRNSSYYWKYDLTAVDIFITKDNINDTITTNGFDGEVGILHIDIDGNDYYIWDAIDCVKADIVIVEYNSLFGCIRPISIVYKSDFQRTKAHHSNNFYGVSLKALCVLAKQKGYSFVGCNSSGNNAYFVKSNKLNGIPEVSCEVGYVKAKFRESRNPDGKLNYNSFEDCVSELKGLDVFNVVTNQVEQF